MLAAGSLEKSPRGGNDQAQFHLTEAGQEENQLK